MIGHWLQLLETCSTWTSRGPVNACIELMWTACWTSVPY